MPNLAYCLPLIGLRHIYASLLAPAPRNYSHQSSDNKDGPSQYRRKNPTIALLGELRLDNHVARRKQIADLVGETWKGSSHRRWRQFVQVRGNYTPRPLNHELHEKTTEREH